MSSPEDKRLRNTEMAPEGGVGREDERWALVQRVVQHESFRRAPRLRELLLFLATRTVEGRTADLTENEVAAAVFGRAESFNSADDSIVRSSVRQLRTKLHEYFEGPGREETLAVEIPKGTYVPEFPRRDVAGAALGVVGEGRLRWWQAVAALCAVAAVLCLGLLALGRDGAANVGGVPQAQNLVTMLFGGRGQEVKVVLCDSALVVVNAHRPRILTLDEYIQGRDQLPLPIPMGRSKGATPPEFPGRRLITSFRDLFFVERLGELSARSGFQVSLKHSRLMQARDFRAGDFVLLGSSWSNPWTVLFEEQLNFRFGETSAGSAFGLRNVHPEPGELPVYHCSSEQSRNGVSYARIAIVRNLSGRQIILLVSGLHTESSEGALDSAMSPAFLDQLMETTGARSAEDLVGVESLLEVRAVDGVVSATRLLASRRHPVR